MKTKFFTGEGDKGESVIGKKSVSKSSALIEFLGGLDELNSWIGFCGTAARNRRQGTENKEQETRNEEIDTTEVLKFVQENLFIVQAEVATLGFNYPNGPQITDDKTKYLEEIILKIDAVLPKIEKFIIPGGSELATRLDVARAIARRVERLAKKYSEENPLSAPLLKFLNRLSSFLFALARYINFKTGTKEENPSYQ